MIGLLYSRGCCRGRRTNECKTRYFEWPSSSYFEVKKFDCESNMFSRSLNNNNHSDIDNNVTNRKPLFFFGKKKERFSLWRIPSDLCARYEDGNLEEPIISSWVFWPLEGYLFFIMKVSSCYGGALSKRRRSLETASRHEENRYFNYKYRLVYLSRQSDCINARVDRLVLSELYVHKKNKLYTYIVSYNFKS